MASRPAGASLDVKLHKSGALMRRGFNGAIGGEQMIPQLNICWREMSFWASVDNYGELAEAVLTVGEYYYLQPFAQSKHPVAMELCLSAKC